MIGGNSGRMGEAKNACRILVKKPTGNINWKTNKEM